MYTLQTDTSFDSAHFLKGYEGKCSNIHGHRWKISIQVYGEALETEGQMRGMIVDFSTLKQDLKEIADDFDHALLVERGSLKPNTRKALTEEGFRMIELEFRPTAEHLAKHIYCLMENKGYQVLSVTVYETPNNCATFRQSAIPNQKGV